MTANLQGVRASASLGMLLAHELLGAPVPTAAASILPVTERARNVAEAICEEVLLRGNTDGDAHRTLLALEERWAARMKYRGTQAVRYTTWWFRQVTTVGPKDRSLVPLPGNIEFLYRYIRLVRLAVKGSRRIAHALWLVARRGRIGGHDESQFTHASPPRLP